MRALALLAIALSPALCAEPATERYAPAQLRVAQEMLERAHAAVALGEIAQAGKFAWQARLDASLAWQMTDSQALRADAAQVSEAAAALVATLVRR